jgi:hypothetical protein
LQTSGNFSKPLPQPALVVTPIPHPNAAAAIPRKISFPESNQPSRIERVKKLSGVGRRGPGLHVNNYSTRAASWVTEQRHQ